MMRFSLQMLGFVWVVALSVLAQQRPGTPVFDATPRIGVLIPKGPPDYGLMLDALRDGKIVADGPFEYRTGTIAGVAVVLTIQPTDGEVMRALGAITMIHDFNLRAVVYPGTSGGLLARGEMGIGDVVLGAKNVDHGNYYLSPTGEIEAGEFNAMQKGMPHYMGRCMRTLDFWRWWRVRLRG